MGLMKTQIETLKGVGLCVLLGALALVLGPYVKQLGSITLAIILGLIFSPFVKLSKPQEKGVHFCSKDLLGFTVGLLGLNLNISVIHQLGGKTLVAIIFLVASTVLITVLLGKLLKLPISFSLLLGIGSGICGSSAIAATANLVTKKKEDIVLSMGVINILGTCALFMAPMIFKYYPAISGDEIGIMIGGTLQAVGHVIAIGHFFDEQTADLALSIKMIRVALLLPLVLCLSLWHAKRKNHRAPLWHSVPFYIYGFLFCAIINYFEILPTSLLSKIKSFSFLTLAIAMSGLGLGVKIKDFQKNLSRGFLLGVVIFILQIVGLSSIL